MEKLEERIVLANIVWDGGPNGMGTVLDDPVNWAGDVLPGPGDAAFIDTAGPDIVQSGGSLEFGSLEVGLFGGGPERKVTATGLTLSDATAMTSLVVHPDCEFVVAGTFSTASEILVAPQDMGEAPGRLVIAGTVLPGPRIENLGDIVLRTGANLQRNIDNVNGLGVVEITGGTLASGATIANDNVVMFSGSGTLSGGGTISNFRMVLSSGTSSQTFTVRPEFLNFGASPSVTVESGTLVLGGGGSFNADGAIMTVDAGATLILDDFEHDAGSRLVADGTIQLTGDHAISATGSGGVTQWTGSGVIELTGGGAKTFQTDFALDVATFRLAMSSGAAGLNGPGVVTANGTLEWATGSGPIAGTMVVAQSGRLDITGRFHTLSGRLINQSATSTWTTDLASSTITFDGGVLENQGTLAINLDFGNAQTNAFSGTTNTLLNTGELIVTSVNGGILDTATSLTWDNQGIVRALSGGIELRGPVVQLASFVLGGGEWEVTGPAFIDFASTANIIGPGATVTGRNNAPLSFPNLLSSTTVTVDDGGRLNLLDSDLALNSTFINRGLTTVGQGTTVSADRFFFDPTGQTTVQIGGQSGFGVFAASGSPNTATISGGVLTVELTGGFVPNLNDVYTIIDAPGGRTGTFATVNLPDLSGVGLEAAIEYTPTGVNIRIQQGAVPTIITWTGAGDGTSWIDVGNWDLGMLPGSTQDVVIPDVLATTEIVCDATQPIEINSLQCSETLRLTSGCDYSIVGSAQSSTTSMVLEGAIFASTMEFIVLQTLDVRGGAINVPGGLTVPGFVVIENGTTVIDDTLWTLSGGVEWQGGDLVSRDTTITLTSGAQWNNTNDGSVSFTADQGGSTFSVGGALIFTGTGSTFLQAAGGGALDVNVASGGSVDVQTGALTVDATGTSFGDWDCSAGATCTWDQDYFHGNGASVGGAGNYIMSAGTHDYNGAFYSASGRTTVQAGATLQYTTAQTVGGEMVVRGAIHGLGVVTYTGSLELACGGALSSAQMSIAPGALMTIGQQGAMGTVAITGAVSSGGTVRWSGCDMTHTGGGWTVATGGTFDAAAEASWMGQFFRVDSGAMLTFDSVDTTTWSVDTENAGAVSWDGGDVVQDGSSWMNFGSGRFDINTTRTWTGQGGATFTSIETSVVTIDPGAGAAAWDVATMHMAILNHETGDFLLLSDWTSETGSEVNIRTDGAWSAPGGAMYTCEAGSTLNIDPGGGTVSWGVATQCGGTTNWLSGDVEQTESWTSGAGANFNAMSDGQWSGGGLFTLDAGASLTVDTPGTSNWQAETIVRGTWQTVNGRTVFNIITVDGAAFTGGEVTVNGNLTIGGTVVFDGTQWTVTNVDWEDGDIDARGFTMTVVGGGSFNVTNVAPVTFMDTSGANSLRIAAGATMNIDAADTVTFGVDTRNAGVANWNSGNVVQADSDWINELDGILIAAPVAPNEALWSVVGDSIFQNQAGAELRFEPVDTVQWGVDTTNAGTVSWNQGDVVQDGVTFSYVGPMARGNISLAAPAEWRGVGGASMQIGQGTVVNDISAPGAAVTFAVDLDIAGSLIVADDLNLVARIQVDAGGLLDVGGLLSVSSSGELLVGDGAAFTAGNLANDGQVQFVGKNAAASVAGTLSGAGTTMVEGGITLSVADIDNDGILDVIGPGTVLDVDGSTLNGGTIRLNQAVLMTDSLDNQPAATITITVGGGIIYVGSAQNSGEITGDTLTITGGGPFINAGRISVGSESSVQADGDVTNAAGGSITLASDSDIITQGSFGNSGSVSLDSGVIEAAGSFTNETGGVINSVNGGGILFNGVGRNNGTITAGAFGIFGIGDFLNSATISLGAGSSVDITGVFGNASGATISLASGSDFKAEGGAENDGTITAESSTFQFGGTAGGGLLNGGDISLSGAGGAVLVNGSVDNSGTLSLIGAVVSITSDYTGSGSSVLELGGPNSEVTSVDNITLTDQAGLTVRSDVAFVQVDEDLTLGSETTVRVGIASTNTPVLNVTGAAAIDGSLVVEYDGFLPTEGARFRFLTAGAMGGSFTTVTLPEAPPGDKTLLIEGGDFLEILNTDQADFDGNGLLDIFDFLAFQDLFILGDPQADLDGDGMFTIFDFLAFQDLFSDG